MFNPSSPITGATITGFTANTYTITADQAPSNLGKQWYVSAINGTQVGVSAHSVNLPFTISAFRPAVFKPLPPVNPVSGKLQGSPPVNTVKVITRKGVTPLAGQANAVMRVVTTIEVPAGAESNDIANVKAAISAHAGALYAQADGLQTTMNTGSL